jgi:hypothetical protein
MILEVSQPCQLHCVLLSNQVEGPKQATRFISIFSNWHRNDKVLYKFFFSKGSKKREVA